MGNDRQKTSDGEETPETLSAGSAASFPRIARAEGKRGRLGNTPGIFTGAAALRKSHETLTAKVHELARSNAELAHFAGAVAHDLRGPLQSLNNCVELLGHEHLNNLSTEGYKLIDIIRESTGHMTRLIRSLLDCARAEHACLELAPCDANSVLRTALNGLQADVHAAAAQVTSDPLPVVRGDPTQLAQLLQNLIENAIKYHGDAPPRVHVSAREEPGLWTFSVRDHGMGIDPQHFDSIFGVFKRLPSAKLRSSGLGVGLATCKKIVERHGGRIWVESQPGNGATFFFSLPNETVVSNEGVRS